MSGREREKADSHPSTVWSDRGLAMDRAHGLMTAKDIKVLNGILFNVVANQQVHKLVQVIRMCALSIVLPRACTNDFTLFFQVLGESLHIAFKYLTHEAKVASLASRMEVLEAENSTLKKKLIESMHEVNILKESSKTLADDLRAERQLTLEKDEQLLVAKDKLKTIAARSIEGFQQTNEYNIMLFSWYFKGFELLRHYLVKHPSDVGLQSLDLEVVDQEMTADEATQSSAPKEPAADQPNAQDTSTAVNGDDAPANP